VTPRKPLWPPLAAALISAVLHVGVMTGVSWRLPQPVIETPPLEARLVSAPPAVQTPPPPRHVEHKPPPRRAAGKPKVVATAPASTHSPPADFTVPAAPESTETPEAAVPTIETPSQAVPSETVAATPSGIPAPEESEPPRLPRRGRISYTLYVGMQKFEVGRTVQTWEIEDGSYRIGSVSETTGVAELFRAERRTYLSVGKVTRDGLRPTSFLMSRTRRGASEVARARFDWEGAHITWGTTDEKNEAALAPGSQDFLSLMYQLSVKPPRSDRIRVPITTGTKFETYELDVLPEETLDTPLGPLRALPLRQVRKPGTETIQIWLAADYRYLPVQLRFYGRDGAPTGEQVVNDIRVGEEQQ